MQYKNNSNIDDLVKQASEKVGANPEELKKSIDSGKLDSILNKMNPNDAKRFQEIISNPQLARQMLNTPQAQAIIKNFMKK